MEWSHLLEHGRSADETPVRGAVRGIEGVLALIVFGLLAAACAVASYVNVYGHGASPWGGSGDPGGHYLEAVGLALAAGACGLLAVFGLIWGLRR